MAAERLHMGDLFKIETANDIASQMEALKAKQSSSSTPHEKEQIAWEILTLTRRLNDEKITSMKVRAQGELDAIKSELSDVKNSQEDIGAHKALQAILEKFLGQVDALESKMTTVRATADAAKDKATIGFISQFAQMEAVAGTSVAKQVTAPTEATKTSTPAPAPVASKKEEKKEEILSFGEIASTLRKSGHTTKQVQEHAGRIQTALLSAPNKEAVLSSVEILVNPKKDNKDFQKSLGMPDNAVDGFIGRDTINLLLQKAGSTYRLPEEKHIIKASAESKETKAPSVPKATKKPVTKVDTPVVITNSALTDKQALHANESAPTDGRKNAAQDPRVFANAPKQAASATAPTQAPSVAPKLASSAPAKPTSAPGAAPKQLQVKSVPETFDAYKAAVEKILADLDKKTPVSVIGQNKDLYYGIDINSIEQALLAQRDGEFYLYDKPESGVRNVYRLDSKKNPIGFMTIDTTDTIVQKLGAPMSGVTYNIPAWKITRK